MTLHEMLDDLDTEDALNSALDSLKGALKTAVRQYNSCSAKHPSYPTWSPLPQRQRLLFPRSSGSASQATYINAGNKGAITANMIKGTSGLIVLGL